MSPVAIACAPCLFPTDGAVLRQVLGQGAKLAAIGVASGLMITALLGRLIASLLYEVKPLDATMLAGVSILSVECGLSRSRAADAQTGT